MSILQEGHRKRLRERWMLSNSEGFTDYELLELLLSYAIPRKDTKNLAKELINHFGSLRKVLQTDLDRLKNYPGLGEHSGVLLKLCYKFTTLQPEKIIGKSIQSSEDLIEYFINEIGDCSEEKFYCTYLNQKNKVLAIELIEHGIENKANIYIKRIIRKAMDYHATALICIHNHPSESKDFSRADILLTEKLKETCMNLDIRLLDHILICKQNSFSMNQQGLL